MKCTICQNSEFIFLLNPRRGGQIYICKRCTNAFTFPVPSVEYSHDSFFKAAEDQEKLFRQYAKPIIEFIKSKKNKGCLLDIGTGGGYLMEEAKNEGFEVFGVEPSSQAVAFCRRRNLNVKKGYFNEKMYPPKYFDIVVASHVLEHVTNASLFLKSIHTVLKDGGIVCLSQTNYTGTIPYLYGSFWEGWVPDQHLVHFSPKGIEFLMRKTHFQVMKIKHLSLGYFLRFGMNNFSDIANTIYSDISFIISRLKIGFPFIPDQMYVIAKKSKNSK